MIGLKTDSPLERLLCIVSAGLVTGITAVTIELSFAALIFSGPLAPYVARGIGLALFGAIAMSAIVAMAGSLKGTVALPQDSPAAIIALVSAAIVASMPPSASGDSRFNTVVASIIVSSLLTAVVFILLGRFKLGSLTRFVPYPVVGGFLAGTGWLLLQGAIGMMAGIPLGLSQLPHLFDLATLISWLPGALLGVFLLVVLRHHNHFLITPIVLLGAVAVFYSALAAANMPIEEASSRGWLLGPFPQEALWQPITPGVLSQVSWLAILGQADKMVTIVFIGVVSLLFNASGLELVTGQDIDLNRELLSAGIANLVSGLGGGSVGYQTLSLSALANRMGASSRLVGILVAAFCGLLLVYGASIVAIFPKMVLGGLLLFLGLSFLVEWVYDGRFKLARIDYALVILILLIIITIGFLPGVAVGTGIAIMLFVVNYSRIAVVRHTLSGADFHSTVDRPASQRQLLRENGEQLEILQLQGFIFFGTAASLLNQIRCRLADSRRPRLRFLVLDFSRVTGLDSSAVSSFARMKQVAESQELQVALTSVTSEMECQLERGGLVNSHSAFDPTRVVHFMPNMDTGVEWCEDVLLATKGVSVSDCADTLEEQIDHVFAGPAAVTFLRYLDKIEVDKGVWLIRQGDPPDCLYFLERGLTTAWLDLPDGRSLRLRTMRCGTIIGEVGLYLGTVRTASVITMLPSVLYRLSAEAIRTMEERDPEVAAALHKWIARLMAERLAENNNTLRAMMD